jgi:putative ABC transport system permease protein
MKLLRLAWKNLVASPLSTLLSLILFALGVGLVSLILLLNHQLDDKFERNLAGIDMVVGAKGSPLQIILCSIFHIDFPTGNIPLKQANGLKRNPMIDRTIDMALGDSHKGFRIVGTTKEYVDLYEGKVAKGRLWGKTYEVTVGATVAKTLDLDIGSHFHSSHGFADDGFEHDHGDHFEVVGILEGSGSVLDQLILTNVESVWAVHDHGPDTIAIEDREITSMLVFFKNRMANVKLPRMINENTDMQAASPAFEMARLYNMMGAGESMLRVLAYIIIGVSGLSIFISLFNSLRARKYELALMRVSGASKGWLFTLVILEGLLIAILGYLLGMAISHVGMEMLSGYLSQEYRYDFTGWMFLRFEGIMFVAALFIGFLAAIIPAIIASSTDISSTLSEG